MVIASAQSSANLSRPFGPASARSPTVYLDNEAIETMVERGSYLVPTLLATRGLLDAAAPGELTDEKPAQGRDGDRSPW